MPNGRVRLDSYPGHGSCDLTCVICGRQIRRNPADVHEYVVCGSTCRMKMVRKRIDEDPTLPQITCRGCGRIFRTRSRDSARCPDCHLPDHRGINAWRRVP